jgi:hypothetical protein
MWQMSVAGRLDHHERPGGPVFQVLNRGVRRRNLFAKAGDFEAFGRLSKETLRLRPVRVCGFF